MSRSSLQMWPEAYTFSRPLPVPHASRHRRVGVWLQVAREWQIPAGGKGRVIVVPTATLTDEGMRVLGDTLRREATGDRMQFITVYDDLVLPALGMPLPTRSCPRWIERSTMRTSCSMRT